MRQVKNSLRYAVANAHYLTDRSSESLKGAVVILAYHRVLPENELERCYVQRGMYVSPEVFELQMSFLKRNFRVLRFSEFLEIWNNRSLDKKQRYCVITFDDGWLDNYVYAYPILRKYGLPATIFIPTSCIGTNQWFWPEKLSYLLLKCFSGRPAAFLHKKWPWMKSDKSLEVEDRIDAVIESVKPLPEKEIGKIIEQAASNFGLKFPDERILLNWDEIAEMSGSSVSFGSKTANHSVLTKLTYREAEAELKSSLNMLSQKNINHVAVLSYPNGQYTREIAELAAAVGYSAAVTIERGHQRDGALRLFELKRICVHNDMTKTVPLFNFRISVAR